MATSTRMRYLQIFFANLFFLPHISLTPRFRRALQDDYDNELGDMLEDDEDEDDLLDEEGDDAEGEDAMLSITGGARHIRALSLATCPPSACALTECQVAEGPATHPALFGSRPGSHGGGPR